MTITPEHPEPGDEIIVTAEIEGNISNVILQVCYESGTDYVCLLPKEMKKIGNATYQHSFKINKEAEVTLHFKIIENGTIRWDNSTTFKVEKKGNGTPGFMAVTTICTIAILLLKRRS